VGKKTIETRQLRGFHRHAGHRRNLFGAAQQIAHCLHGDLLTRRQQQPQRVIDQRLAFARRQVQDLQVGLGRHAQRVPLR